MSDLRGIGSQLSQAAAKAKLARMTDLEIRAELREVAGKLAGLSQRRHELIIAALDAGVRVGDVAADSGLGRSRIYQIKDEADSP